MAAGSTYTPIATTTLASAAASYTFTSIPGTYTDLVLVCNGKKTGSQDNINVQLNATTALYSNTHLYGTGSVAASARNSNQATWTGIGQYTTSFNSMLIVNIMNYTNPTIYKSMVSRFSNASTYVFANAGLCRDIQAVTTVKLTLDSGNFDVGSTFTLYGIAAA